MDLVILQLVFITLQSLAGSGAYFLWAYVLAPLYMIFWEASRYQASPGKLVLKLKVVDESGNRLTLSRGSARTVASVLNLLTLWIGFFMSGVRRDRLALHDLLTHTRVIRSPRRPL